MSSTIVLLSQGMLQSRDWPNSASALLYRAPMVTKADARTIFAANLRALMQRRGWRQEDLEAKSGISQTYISRLLRKQADPTIRVVEDIGAAFDIPGWVLLIPNLDGDTLDSRAIPALVETFRRAAAPST